MLRKRSRPPGLEVPGENRLSGPPHDMPSQLWIGTSARKDPLKHWAIALYPSRFQTTGMGLDTNKCF